MTFNKKEFCEKITQLQFSSDVQATWNSLEEGVLKNAQSLHQHRIDCGTEGSALNDWWRSCCELYSGRQIIISGVNFDGAGEEGQEFIELYNTGPLAVDLAGWRINAGNEGQDMVFPEQSYVFPLQTIRIYTHDMGQYNFNSSQPIWNNKGDKAFVYDQQGQLISSWSYGVKAHDDVVISNIFFDGIEKFTEGDEYIEIINLHYNWLDLSGWKISAGKDQTFIFPENSIVKPKETIRVYTNHLDETFGGYSFGSPKAIWNNKGDVGVLSDYRDVQVAEYKYG